MKITKRGELPGDKIWMGRCSVCKSEAEATQSELQGCIDSDPRVQNLYILEVHFG